MEGVGKKDGRQGQRGVYGFTLTQTNSIISDAVLKYGDSANL